MRLRTAENPAAQQEEAQHGTGEVRDHEDRDLGGPAGYRYQRVQRGQARAGERQRGGERDEPLRVVAGDRAPAGVVPDEPACAAVPDTSATSRRFSIITVGCAIVTIGAEVPDHAGFAQG